MGKAVAEYGSCDVSIRSKKTDEYGKTPMKEYQAGAPMERVHIDLLALCHRRQGVMNIS